MPRSIRMHPRLLGALLLVTASLLLQGCGLLIINELSDDEEPEPATSVRYTMHLEPLESGPDLPRGLNLDMEGVVVDEGARAYLAADVPVPGAGPGPEIELILQQEGETYLRFAGPRGEPIEDRKWLELNDSQLGDFIPNGQNFEELLLGENLLRRYEPPDDAELIGVETIRGSRSQGYERPIPLEQVAAQMGIPPERALELEGVLGDTIALELWIDELGYARRLDVPFAIPMGRPPELRPAVLSVELYEYDHDEDVELPEGNEIRFE